MTDKSEERAALEAKATKLGVKFAANIGDDTLADRVADAEAEAAKNTKPEVTSGSGDSADAPAQGPVPAGDQSSPATTTPPEPGGAGAAPQGVVPAASTLVVVGPKKGFRRAGYHFGPEPTVIPLTDLTEDQFMALTTETMLVTALREGADG